MNKNKLALGLIAVGILSRILPHDPNFTAVGAATIFAGIYLPKKYTFVIPLSIMLVSDLFLGFHQTMGWVYASYILIALLSTRMKHIIVTPLVSSVLFFVITNFGVWNTGTMYAHNLAGLIECYTMGLPFFRGTLAGDMVYTALLVGGYSYFLADARRELKITPTSITS